MTPRPLESWLYPSPLFLLITARWPCNCLLRTAPAGTDNVLRGNLFPPSRLNSPVVSTILRRSTLQNSLVNSISCVINRIVESCRLARDTMTIVVWQLQGKSGFGGAPQKFLYSSLQTLTAKNICVDC